MRRRAARVEKKMYGITYGVGDRVRVYLMSNLVRRIPTKPTWMNGWFYWPVERPLKEGLNLFLQKKMDELDDQIRKLEDRKDVVRKDVKRALTAPVIEDNGRI